MLGKSTLMMIIMTLLTLTIILGIGVYTIFQQQPQNDQQSIAGWSNTFHHDMARTGYTTSTGPLTNQTIWTHLTQMQIEYSSPAVIDGLAYFGSNDHRVRAVNASTGNITWSYLTGNSVESSCTVAEGIVYFGSHDHNVYALNSTTGTKIWSHTTGNWIESTPSIANGILYIGSNDAKVYAFG